MTTATPRPTCGPGVGRARSGAGAAIVGDPDQVVAKLQAYRDVGIDAFILSGYTHRAEAELVAEHVLPRLEHAPFKPHYLASTKECVGMTTDSLRYGIIGSGMMGIEHIENLNALAGATVVAAADPHPASHEAAVQAADGPIDVYDNYEDMVAAGNCDVLVVATPNIHHITVLSDILTTDLPVLIEKPMCTTVEDCQTVVAMAAEREGSPCGLGSNTATWLRWPASSNMFGTGRWAPYGWWPFVSTVSRFWKRSTTGTGTAPTPAAPSSRSAATSST